MGAFREYHPFVNFIYFVFTIGFSMIFMHPICLSISLLCGLVYFALIGKKKTVKENGYIIVFVILIASIVNPAFSHQGVTVLGYLPTGNPLTLESIIYGFMAGIMLAGVMCWFFCYNEIMTSDKFIYLFGRIIPSLSLLFSMILRFIPRFTGQLKRVSNSQKCMGKDASSGKVLDRVRSGLLILSITVTWALENSVETADSMRNRGYGLKGRSAFSIFKFEKRDIVMIGVILTLGSIISIAGILGIFKFTYFPMLDNKGKSGFQCVLFVIYGFLFILPIVIETWEVRRWKVIQSRI